MDRNELFAVDLVLLHPELGIVPAVIMLGLAVLLGFYFWHCFFLENTVQSWYRIAEKVREKGVRRRRTRVVYDKIKIIGSSRTIFAIIILLSRLRAKYSGS